VVEGWSDADCDRINPVVCVMRMGAEGSFLITCYTGGAEWY